MSVQSPKFVKRPSIRQDDDKTTIIIESLIQAHPKPECTWTLNDKQIAHNSRISSGIEANGKGKKDDYLCFLKIKQATIEDGGSYGLVVQNSAGSLRASVNLNLQADSAQPVNGIKGSRPAFSEKPVIRQDMAGNKVIFECKLSADPKPECVWFKGDAPVKDDSGKYSLSMSPLPDNCYIVSCVVSDVGKLDGGSYVVVAKNAIGEASAKMNLNFDDDKGRPQISSDILTRCFTTDTGSNVVIQCECEGDPIMDFVWSFVDKEITTSDKYSINATPIGAGRYLCSLTINKATKQDTGIYRLVVKNQSGEHSATVNVDISTISRKLPVGFAPKLVGVPKMEKKGKDLKLIVETTGDPTPIISWTKNKKTLADDMYDLNVERTGNKYTSTLTIKNYTISDAGNFECKAANEYGSCISEIGLKVQGRDIVQSSVLKKGASMVGEPRIHYSKRDAILSITCEFEDVDDLKFDWFKGGAALLSGSKYKMSKKQKPKGRQTVTLDITNFNKDSDDGIYRLQAQWPSGQANYNINVISEEIAPNQDDEELKDLESPKKLDLSVENNKIDSQGEIATPSLKQAPKFIGNFKPIIAFDGDKITMSCGYQGDQPISAKWWLDGRPLPNTEEYETSQVRNSVSLTIADAFTQDSGNYRCVISNELGSDEKTCRVTVTGRRGKIPRRKPPSKPKKTPKIEDESPEPVEESNMPVTQTSADPTAIKKLTSQVADDPMTKPESKVTPPGDLIDMSKSKKVTSQVAGDIMNEPDKRKTQTPSPGISKSKTVSEHPDDSTDARQFTVPIEKETTPTTTPAQPQSSSTHQSDTKKVALNQPQQSEPSPTLQPPLKKGLRKISVNKVATKQDKFGQAAVTTFGSSGQWPTLRKTTVAKKVPDHWVTHLVDTKANESDGSVTIAATFCRAVGKLRWYKNRVEIFHGQKYNFITEGPVQKLQINKIIPDDSGRYICSVNDIETKAWLEVTPAKPEYDFYLLLPSKNNVFRTKNVILECHVNSPNCPVKWLKGGRPIPENDPKYKFYLDGTRCVLRINRVARDDEDKFTCMIDDGNKKITECYLYVEEPQWRFSKKLVDKLVVDEKDTFELCVEVEDPDAECEWYFKGNIITEDDFKNGKYEVIVNGTKRKLIVNNADPLKDPGSYECHTGVMTTDCMVQVRPLLRFLEELRDIESVEHQDVTLKVVLTKPKPLVTWMRDGKRILPSASNVILSQGETHILTLKNVSPAEAGKYSVKVDNLESVASINIREADKPPQIGDFPKFVEVSVGKPLRVTVPFKGFPTPTVRWLKDGKPVDLKSANIDTSKSESVLEIPVTQNSDKGIYTAVVENSSGKQEVNIDVHVCDRPKPPEGPLRVSKITKSDCVVSWNAPENDGGSSISAYVIEQLDTTRGEWIECGQAPANVHTIPIRNLTENRQYSFRVKAKNAVGLSDPLETSTAITAKDPFDPPSSPENILVKDINSNYVILGWNAPSKDGGALIEKFVIDQRELGSSEWKRACEVSGDKLDAKVINLVPDKNYEFKVTAVNKAGPGDPGILSKPVRTEPKTVRPMISKGSLKDLTLKVGQTIKLSLSYTAKPEPECRWEKNGQVIDQDDRTSIVRNNKACEITITNAQRSDGGLYAVTLTNPAGSDVAKAHVVVLGPPGKMSKPLRVTDVTSKSAVLSWNPPDDDGGRPIKNYIIEKREPGGQWTEVGNTPSLQFKISKLKEGQAYDFRVIAENAIGRGEPLQTIDPIVAKNPYDIPDATPAPIILGRDRKHIELKWVPPENDGGAPIVGYVIERKQPDSTVWKQIHIEEIIPENSFVDKKVTANAPYEYRVKAVNKAGPSKPSQSTGIVQAKPETEPPKIDDGKLPGLEGQKEIRIYVGQPLEISMDFVGSPNNVVSWVKDKEPVTQEVGVKNEDENSTLTIPVSKRDDSGVYTMRVKNDLGEDSVDVKVTVIAPPGPCTGPLVPVETTDDSVVFKWEAPKDDGGLPIDEYLIEKCEKGSTVWEPAGTCPAYQTKIRVGDLKPMSEYNFRVMAKNKTGKGEPLQTESSVLVKPPYDPPSQPTTPEITSFDVDHISLEWNKPNNDGGNPISGYIVEMKDGRGDWTPCSTKLVDDTKFTATALKPNHTYEFRVKAVNDAGPGPASQPSNQQKAISPINPPGAPEAPEITNVNRNSATVQWKPPIEDGGDKITKYTVEMRSANTEWIPVVETNSKDRQVNVPNLREDSEVSFRVIATNSAGMGIPSPSSNAVTIKDPPAPPVFTALSKIKDVTVRAGQPFTVSTTYMASPEVTVECMNDDNIVITDDDHIVKAENGILTISSKFAKRSESGPYKVTLRNTEGLGSATFNVNVLDVPKKPEGPLEVSAIDHDRCMLQWSPPRDDGGSPVSSYIIEKRPVGDETWVKAGPSTPGTTQTIRNLENGVNYEFRVMAENDSGRSEPLITTEAVKIKSPHKAPDMPGRPHCTDHTESSLTIAWDKPPSDGGAPITGYLLEYREGPNSPWMQYNKAPKAMKSATVGNLVNGQSYDFRVAAVNIAGQSPWADCDAPIEARPPDSAPFIPFTIAKTVNVKVGEPILLDIPFVASPIPDCVLTKNGINVPEDDRHIVMADRERVCISIPSAKLEDAGAYSCLLRNNVGKAECNIHVNVVDKPSKPEGPLRATNQTSSGCLLTWSPPLTDNGLPITNYVIEKCDVETGKWEVASKFCRDPKYEVFDLDENHSYLFRVSAENDAGVSEPLVIDAPIKAQYPTAAPSPPRNFEVAENTTRNVVLKWDPPSKDNGAKVQGYLLDYKMSPSDDWSCLTVDPIRDTSFCVDHLMPSSTYQFRICALNAAGKSEFEQLDRPVKTKNLLKPPQAPHHPEALSVGSDFVQLVWDPPVDQDGMDESPLTYKVEMKLPNSNEWVPGSTQLTSDNFTTISGLPPNADVEFRVCAVNAAGEGAWSESSGKIKVTGYPDGTQPAFTRTPVDVVANPSSSARVEVEFMGTPMPDVRWLKNGLEISPGLKHVIQTVDNRSTLILQDIWEVDDGTEFTCELSNPLGVETASCSLSVRMPPTFGNVEHQNDVVVGSRLGVQLPLSGSSDGRQIEIRKLDDGAYIDASDMFDVRQEDGEINLVIKNAKLDDSGEYVVVAKNGAGSASTHFGINVRGVPDKPEGPLNANDITKTSCKLNWKPPRNDGNSHITHYVVEKHDLARPSDQWVTIDPCCKATSVAVNQLLPDHEYEFRVKAVNNLGESTPLYTASTILAALPFGPPKCMGSPNVTDVGDNFVRLNWPKAISDSDNSPIIYHVEKRMKGQDNWQPVKTAGTSTTNSVEIPNLVEDEEYQFRIVPENEAGIGDPSMETDFVLIRNPYGIRAPQIIKKCEDVTVKEQCSAKFEIEVADLKDCEITWLKGVDEIHNGPDYSISKIGNVVSLTVNNPKPTDNEETFTFKVRNPEGVRSCRANLTVLSKPRIKLPARYNEVQEFTNKDTDITIRVPFTSNPPPESTWFVNGQVLNDGSGVKITTTDRVATLQIDNCAILGDSGRIELQLANSVGQAETAIDFKISGNPGTPMNFKTDALYDDCVTLVWQAPANDGGSPIIDFEVEMIDPMTGQWTKIGACRSTRIVVPNLNPDSDYQFRVKAVNLNGYSQPSTAILAHTQGKDDDRLSSRAPYGLGPDGQPVRGIEGQIPDDYDRLFTDIWRTEVNPRPPLLNTGNIYEKYDVFEELGRSPFAVVHRAVCKSTGKNYAVKFVETQGGDGALLVEKEIDRMANLIDPNIINLREAYQNRDETVLVYELLTGDTLADKLVKSARMTEPEAIAIVKQICQAVKTLHDNDMVHLDLKPESFIESTAKSPQYIKLADFSLASKVVPNEEIQVSLASTEFAAPEIKNHEPVGFGSDMWAIGALAYAILTGEGPSDSKQDDTHRRDAKDFEIPNKFDNDISEKGKDFIRSLLKHDKNARMNIYDALNHPWLNEIEDKSYPTLHPNYEGMKSRISDKYKGFSPVDLPDNRLGIGSTSWHSKRICREPRKYDLYKSTFDTKEYVPRIYVFKHDSYVLEGDRAELSARVVSTGDVSIKWVKGTEVRMSSRISKRGHKNAHYLEIRRCTLEDGGQYTFTARNNYGEKSVPIELHVQQVKQKDRPKSPPSPQRRVREYSLIDVWQEPNKGPFFTHVLRARVVQSGQLVKLSCTVAGRPIPKISWFKGSVEITNDENYLTANNHGVATLEIPRASISDTGSYSCQAENSMGSAVTSCQLLVQGSTSKYGRYLQKSSEVHSVETSDNVSFRRTTYSRVSISKSDYSISTSSASEVSERQQKQERRSIVASPPTIEEPLESITLFDGAILQMRCKISSRPTAQITWLKNDDVISPDTRVTQDYIQNEARLTINPINVYDSGEYQIIAINEAGRASCAATVDVRAFGAKQSLIIEDQGLELQTEYIKSREDRIGSSAEFKIDDDLKPSEGVAQVDRLSDAESSVVKKTHPYITNHLESFILKSGDPLTLRCGISCNDGITAIWRRNDRVVPENPDFAKSIDQNDVVLTVTEMFPEDSGTFSVEIVCEDEVIGKSACTICVYDDQDSQLEHPLVAVFPCSLNASPGENVTFLTTVNRPCKSQWSFNDRIIEDNNTFKVYHVNPTEHGLSISSVAKAHEGMYTLTLLEVGEDPLQISAYLNVL